MGNRVSNEPLSPLGYQQITSLSTAASLTVPAGTTHILIQAETQNVRWRDDGIAPTGTVGMLLTAGAAPVVYAGEPGALQFIETAASAVLNVTYYSD